MLPLQWVPIPITAGYTIISSYAVHFLSVPQQPGIESLQRFDNLLAKFIHLSSQMEYQLQDVHKASKQVWQLIGYIQPFIIPDGAPKCKMCIKLANKLG